MKLHRKQPPRNKSMSRKRSMADFVVDKTAKPQEYDPYKDPFLS